MTQPTPPPLQIKENKIKKPKPIKKFALVLQFHNTKNQNKLACEANCKAVSGVPLVCLFCKLFKARKRN